MIRLLLGLLWMSCLMVLCYSIETDTPYNVAGAVFFAMVLGGLISDTAHTKGL